MSSAVGVFQVRQILVLVLAASLGALIAALAGQYVLGLEPCVLCLWQRVPYVLTSAIAGLGLLGWIGRTGRPAVALSGGVFALGAALAFYHVGVQEHWWAAVPGCGGEPVTTLTVDDLRADALERPPKRCDEVDWRLFGLSLAGWNTLAFLLLAAVCIAWLTVTGKARTA